MANFNKVILAGNLTRDPEMRYTPKGTAIAKFGLAVNRTWKSETGETKEEVTFVDVEAWDKQAEVIAQYLKKGSPSWWKAASDWTSGRTRIPTRSRANSRLCLEGFSFLDVGNRGDSADAAGARPAAAPTAASGAPRLPPKPKRPEPEQDDVPF